MPRSTIPPLEPAGAPPRVGRAAALLLLGALVGGTARGAPAPARPALPAPAPSAPPEAAPLARALLSDEGWALGMSDMYQPGNLLLDYGAGPRVVAQRCALVPPERAEVRPAALGEALVRGVQLLPPGGPPTRFSAPATLRLPAAGAALSPGCADALHAAEKFLSAEKRAKLVLVTEALVATLPPQSCEGEQATCAEGAAGAGAECSCCMTPPMEVVVGYRTQPLPASGGVRER